jgi:hypothetical protein
MSAKVQRDPRIFPQRLGYWSYSAGIRNEFWRPPIRQILYY